MIRRAKKGEQSIQEVAKRWRELPARVRAENARNRARIQRAKEKGWGS